MRELLEQYISISFLFASFNLNLSFSSLITIVQPSGTDCPAVIKYEKSAKEFITKVKTRTICLLDISQLNSRLNLLPISKHLFDI